MKWLLKPFTVTAWDLRFYFFFKGLKIILCVPHWCVSDLSKSLHANSNFNIQNVNISQVPIILHSCRPTLLMINLISVPLWDFMFCPLNLQLYIIFFEWFYLMFLFLLIRSFYLGPLLSSKFHTSTGLSATFSVTREIWGKTDAEIEEEKGIPEPPREVTLYNITRAIKFNGLIFSTGSAAAEASLLLEKTITWYGNVSWSEQLVWQQFK